jgi:vancomycin resistance protein YoaR
MKEQMYIAPGRYTHGGPSAIGGTTPMSLKLRVFLSAIPVVLLAIPTTAFAFSEALARGEIEPEVSAAGIDLSGLGRDDALEAMRAYETELRATTVQFKVKDTPFSLSPATVALAIDEESIVDQAMAVRRETGLISRFTSWLTSSREFPTVEIAVELQINDARLDDVFDAWESGAIAVPPYEGNILVTNGQIIPEYPRPGEGVDRPVARELASAAILSFDKTVVQLPTKFIQPELTADQLNDWVEQASTYVDSPVTLTGTDPDVEITFSRKDLFSALRTELKTSSPATFKVWLDPAAILPLLEPIQSMIEQPPRDAEVIVDEDEKNVTVIPSRNGVVLDDSLVMAAVIEAALGDAGVGPLPYAEGEAPEITTDHIAAWGPLGLVSSFTTKHACCADRVHNIHLFADTVDGAIVLPGADFSLNARVGQRKGVDGYREAGTLVNGELVDTVGGGVSQFATTFYNTVFYGCYEDVGHKPHTYYFSRYPEVNEATINWPNLDLKFRNDSNAPVWIKANYTGTTITVEFYGNNGGRACDRRLGTRYAFTTPKDEYKGDPTINPGIEVEERKGRGGWTNTVTRVVTFDDGTVEEQLWTWTYRAQSRLIFIHPCMLDGAEEECPIQVISVVGSSFGAAKGALEGLGLQALQGEEFETPTESLDGTVKSQSISGETWVAAGTTVILDVYKYEAPPPPTTDAAP